MNLMVVGHANRGKTIHLQLTFRMSRPQVELVQMNGVIDQVLATNISTLTFGLFVIRKSIVLLGKFCRYNHCTRCSLTCYMEMKE